MKINNVEINPSDLTPENRKELEQFWKAQDEDKIMSGDWVMCYNVNEIRSIKIGVVHHKHANREWADENDWGLGYENDPSKSCQAIKLTPSQVSLLRQLAPFMFEGEV